MKKFKSFMLIWAVIIILNQVLLFSACFKPYCIIAAIPHTFIITIVIMIFINIKEKEKTGDN